MASSFRDNRKQRDTAVLRVTSRVLLWLVLSSAVQLERWPGPTQPLESFQRQIERILLIVDARDVRSCFRRELARKGVALFQQLLERRRNGAVKNERRPLDQDPVRI